MNLREQKIYHFMHYEVPTPHHIGATPSSAPQALIPAALDAPELWAAAGWQRRKRRAADLR